MENFLGKLHWQQLSFLAVWFESYIVPKKPSAGAPTLLGHSIPNTNVAEFVELCMLTSVSDFACDL